jgi:hypothetical protein
MTTRLICVGLLVVGLTGPVPFASQAASSQVAATTATATDAVWVAQAKPTRYAGRYGPYATMRRANEVANWFSQQGYRAVAFHNGDGYYVDVR